MAGRSINDMLSEVSYSTLKSDAKQQMLIECVPTGNSKQCLGKAYNKEGMNELSAEKVDKLFCNYKVKLSGHMVKSLDKSIFGCIRWELCHLRNEQLGCIEGRQGV